MQEDKLKELEKKRNTQDLIDFLTSPKSISDPHTMLDKGGFNQVFLAFTLQKSRVLRISKKEGEEQPLEDSNLLSKISSSHLILHALFRIGSGAYFKQYDGNLRNFIKDPENEVPEETGKQNLVDEGHFAGVAHQIISAVYDLHLQNIVHCDIKPENFLFFKKNGEIKVVLGDLDEIGEVDENGELKNKTKRVGTVKYSFLDEGDLDQKHADIDATFLTLLELYVGETQQDTQARGYENHGWIAKDKNSKSRRDQWIEEKLKGIKDPNAKKLFDDLRNHAPLEEVLKNPLFSGSENVQKIKNSRKPYYFLDQYPEEYAVLKNQTNSILGGYTSSLQNLIVGAGILSSKFQDPHLNYEKKENLETLKEEYRQWLLDVQKLSSKKDGSCVIAYHLLRNLKKDKNAFENKVTPLQIMVAALGGTLGGASGGASAGIFYGGTIGAAVGSIIPGLGTAVGALLGTVIATLIGTILGAGIPFGVSKVVRYKKLSDNKIKTLEEEAENQVLLGGPRIPEIKPTFQEIDKGKLEENEKSKMNALTSQSVEIKGDSSEKEEEFDDDMRKFNRC